MRIRKVSSLSDLVLAKNYLAVVRINYSDWLPTGLVHIFSENETWYTNIQRQDLGEDDTISLRVEELLQPFVVEL